MGISLKKQAAAYYEEVNLSDVIRDTTTDNFDVPMSDFIHCLILIKNWNVYSRC